MTVECKCPICKGKEHWDPPQPPNPMHVGSWRYQFSALTQKQIDEAQWVNDVGWMVPDTYLQALANAWNADSYIPHRAWIRGKFPKLAAAIEDALTEENR